MRVIKSNKKVIERVCVCHKCESVLGITEEDLQWRDGNWSVICPVCDARGYLTETDKGEIFPWIVEEQNDEELSDNDAVWLNKI